MELIDYVILLFKVVVGISILNVWLVQYNKPTKWRGGQAQNIFEEFEVYGLSKTICYLIGFLKVSLALLLLVSIKFENIALYASGGLAVLLLGSIVMHFKVKDELYKSFPAFLFMVLCITIVYFSI